MQKTTMRKIYYIICIIAMLPLFSGCNDADDVETIFTGKTWKLTLIAHDGSNQMANFWGTDTEKMNKSLQILYERSASFTIRFEGVTSGDDIKGQLSGTTVNTPFSGSWSANGRNRDFNATVTGSDDGDILARNFINGLENATSYDGDSKNLYLIYKEGSATFRMFFHVASQE